MSDYTPTTEEIRADYCLLADVSRPRQLQFDRWLAEVKAQERERIIALLEADCFCQAPEDQHPCWPCQTIALIKGEEQ